MAIIKGKLPELAIFLQDPAEGGIPYDVTFNIVGEGIRKEIKAHKLYLAFHSSIFKSMFYGPMKDDRDVIPVKERSFEAFEKLIEYIYQIDIDCENKKLPELFDIVNLAEMYDMPKLMDELKIQMEKIPLTMDTLMDVANTASQFSQFEVVSKALMTVCAKFLERSVKPADQMKFALDQHTKGRGEIALDLLALVKDLPAVVCLCINCGEVDSLKGERVLHADFRVDLAVKVNKKHSYWGQNAETL